MRKFLVTADGNEYELSPLTQEEFTKINLWCGGDDMAFDAWLRANRLHELDSFRSEVLQQSVIEMRNETVDLLFDPSGENFIPYSEVRAQSISSQTFQNKLNQQLRDAYS
jgi:hypothetical protein